VHAAAVLAAPGWQINSAFTEGVKLMICQQRSLCPGVFHNRLAFSPRAGDAIKEHGHTNRVPCTSPWQEGKALLVVLLPSPARFSHDCNIYRTNVTDGAGRLRYTCSNKRVARCLDKVGHKRSAGETMAGRSASPRVRHAARRHAGGALSARGASGNPSRAPEPTMRACRGEK